MVKALEYLEQTPKLYPTGIAGKAAYRGYLQSLLEELIPGVLVTNELTIPCLISIGTKGHWLRSFVIRGLNFILLRKNRTALHYLAQSI
jgi:hypothetical protein